MSKIVGIVNLTPDSFSDGGKFNNIAAALEQVRKLIAEGADIIDVGAESTRPDALKLTAVEEWQRLEPILPVLIKEVKKSAKEISLDSYHPQTIEKALALGIDYINDVSAFADSKIVDLVKDSQAKYILTHNLGVPVKREEIISGDEDVVVQLKNWFAKKCEILLSKGIARERIIFDLGIGFGKNAQQSLELLQRVSEFADLACEIYIGHSRKSFFQIFPCELSPDKDLETAYISAILSKKQVSYLRVHNVAMSKKLVNLAQYFG